jgi:hypothetical protein
VHDDTQRAPAAHACVTRNVQYTFQTFFRLTRFTVHDDTQRAPAALACITRNAQFTFQTFLRLTQFTVHDDTQRVPAALACVTKNAYLEHIFKKMGSTEIVVSSVCPSVSYFSAAIAPRDNISLLLYSGQ